MYFLHLLQISAAFAGPTSRCFCAATNKMSPREFISLSPLEDAQLSGGWPFKTAHTFEANEPAHTFGANEPARTIQVAPRLSPREYYVKRQMV